MSNFQHKPNTGSLFANDKREKDTDPHAKGTAFIDGVEYWVSAWTNVSEKTGTRYQNMSYKKKEEVHNKGMAQVQQKLETPIEEFPDDSIPF